MARVKAPVGVDFFGSPASGSGPFAWSFESGGSDVFTAEKMCVSAGSGEFVVGMPRSEDKKVTLLSVVEARGAGKEYLANWRPNNAQQITCLTWTEVRSGR